MKQNELIEDIERIMKESGLANFIDYGPKLSRHLDLYLFYPKRTDVNFAIDKYEWLHNQGIRKFNLLKTRLLMSFVTQKDVIDEIIEKINKLDG